MSRSWTTTKEFAMRTVLPVSPGEMLEEEFLKPLGLSKYRLAKDIGVPAQRIGEIVAGRRAVTADTDLRLCRYFGQYPKVLFTTRLKSAICRPC